MHFSIIYQLYKLKYHESNNVLHKKLIHIDIFHSIAIDVGFGSALGRFGWPDNFGGRFKCDIRTF